MQSQCMQQQHTILPHATSNTDTPHPNMQTTISKATLLPSLNINDATHTHSTQNLKTHHEPILPSAQPTPPSLPLQNIFYGQGHNHTSSPLPQATSTNNTPIPYLPPFVSIDDSSNLPLTLHPDHDIPTTPIAGILNNYNDSTQVISIIIPLQSPPLPPTNVEYPHNFFTQPSSSNTIPSPTNINPTIHTTISKVDIPTTYNVSPSKPTSSSPFSQAAETLPPPYAHSSVYLVTSNSSPITSSTTNTAHASPTTHISTTLHLHSCPTQIYPSTTYNNPSTTTRHTLDAITSSDPHGQHRSAYQHHSAGHLHAYELRSCHANTTTTGDYHFGVPNTTPQHSSMGCTPPPTIPALEYTPTSQLLAMVCASPTIRGGTSASNASNPGADTSDVSTNTPAIATNGGISSTTSTRRRGRCSVDVHGVIDTERLYHDLHARKYRKKILNLQSTTYGKNIIECPPRPLLLGGQICSPDDTNSQRHDTSTGSISTSTSSHASRALIITGGNSTQQSSYEDHAMEL
ncbi:hypothetical protein A4A49_16939 [Nicotiana attenuata]|uniref:Uncharacterized protein n=1 Tax=Nicotiana attenuata TaxID=49451 RepID=A0A1J6J9V2_NICAT|nr:hypothetical protein A4A49_16939 [Nicotiana attenuata]